MLRATGGVLLLLSGMWAATAKKPSRAAPASSVPAPAARPAANSAGGHLPVSRVALYKNGVGYFEHVGSVNGDQELSIDFTTDQLNDVLKSLTVLDLGGGHISGIRYNSVAPLEERMRALHLPFSNGASRADFLNALRGARVQVFDGRSSGTGRILSVQQQRKLSATGDVISEATALSIISDSGELRSFELTPAATVRILDATVDEDVENYFKLLDSSRAKDLRRMLISATGAGRRQIFVSYLSEVPVWKTTYRILMPSAENKQPLLQAWAIVDNTSGEDWSNVQLSLVSGDAQSFVQNISQPFYVRRPEVPLPSSIMLTPQTHEEAVLPSAAPTAAYAFGTGRLHGTVTDQSGAVVPGAQVTIRNDATGANQTTTTNAGGNYVFSNVPAGNSSLTVNAAGFQRFELSNVFLGLGRLNEIDARLTVGAMNQTVEVRAEAPTVQTSESVVSARAANLEPQALGKQAGDLFEYDLKRKITIGRNQSALVPILQAPIAAEKVTLWNDSSDYPLHALWLTNTSGQTLDSGTFNIVDADIFAGEGLIDELKPGEKRLISYAADPAIHISAKEDDSPDQVTTVRIAKGVMRVTSEERESKTYLIRNSDTAPRQVILEYPVVEDWKLAPGLKPEETTASLYRFRIPVEPGSTEQFKIDSSRPVSNQYDLSDLEDEQIQAFYAGKSVSPEMDKLFQDILKRQGAISAIEGQINTRRKSQQQIATEQARIRENMKALRGSVEEKALLERYTKELNDQEDRLAALNGEIAKLQAQHDSQQDDLDTMLESVTLSADF